MLPTLALFCKPLGLLVGFLWPSYASYKALEGRSTEAAGVWLTYWVVFSLLAVVESIMDPIMGWWMPLYYPLKLGLVMWLMLPQTRGASIVYHQLLLPFLREHEAQIDQAIEEGRRRTEAWSARILPLNADGEVDHEQGTGASGGPTVYRQWDFSQSVPDRAAGLRGRPAGGGYLADLGLDSAPKTRSELFADRPTAAEPVSPTPRPAAVAKEEEIRAKDK